MHQRERGREGEGREGGGDRYRTAHWDWQRVCGRVTNSLNYGLPIFIKSTVRPLYHIDWSAINVSVFIRSSIAAASSHAIPLIRCPSFSFEREFRFGLRELAVVSFSDRAIRCDTARTSIAENVNETLSKLRDCISN